jgi:hypothetical protein
MAQMPTVEINFTIDASRLSASREAIAAFAHEQWVHWMTYLFSHGDHIGDGETITLEEGSFIIPARLVRRWQQQMEAPYDELLEEEKDSDRAQADKFIRMLLQSDFHYGAAGVMEDPPFTHVKRDGAFVVERGDLQVASWDVGEYPFNMARDMAASAAAALNETVLDWLRDRIPEETHASE